MVKRLGEEESSKIERLIQGDISVIPLIYLDLPYASPILSGVYATTLYDSVEALPYSKLIQLEAMVREKTSMEWYTDWGRMNPVDLIKNVPDEKYRITILGLGTFNPNGYFREKCIIQLGKYTSSQSLKYLLLRMNDWVDIVRLTSEKLFLERINNLGAESLLSAYPYLNRLARTTRVDYSPIIKRSQSILLEEKNRETVRNAAIDGDINTKRIAYMILLKPNDIDSDFLMGRVIEEQDVVIQHMILAGIMRANISTQEKERCLENLLAVKASKVKLFAMEALNKLGRAPWPLFKDLLTDKNMAVRESARYYISKLLGMDFRQCYLDALREAPTYGAICGLGETGTSNDRMIVQGYLDSDNVSLIRASLYARTKLDKEGSVQFLVYFLSDNRAVISCQAYRLLSKSNYSKYEQNIYDIYIASNEPIVKSNCAKLLVSLGKWTNIRYILEFICDSFDGIQEFGRKNYQRWVMKMNRSFQKPTTDQVLTIRNTINRYSQFLPKSIVKDMGFILSTEL